MSEHYKLDGGDDPFFTVERTYTRRDLDLAVLEARRKMADDCDDTFTVMFGEHDLILAAAKFKRWLAALRADLQKRKAERAAQDEK